MTAPATAAHLPSQDSRATLAGGWELAKLVARRDRWLLATWVVLVTGFVAGTVSSFAAAYPTDTARRGFVEEVVANPAITALIGPVLSPGVGGLVAWRIGTAGSMAVAIIAVLAVVRHTRTEEAVGRGELVRAAVVGRVAPLAAAVAVVAAAMVVMGLLIGAALSAQGLPPAGAFALGLSLTGVGWVFIGVAAVAVQVWVSARAASVAGVVVLAVAVVLRMAADAGASAGPAAGGGSWVASLVWLTPTGWMQQVVPFSTPRWWLLGVFALVAVALVGVARALAQRRDLGAGLLRERVGPRHGGSGLGSVFGLAWRQNRGLLAGVVAGYGVLGLLVGAAAPGAARAGAQLGPFLARLGVADAGQALVTLLIYVFGEVLAAYAIATSLRARADEVSGLAFVVLATPVSRVRWVLAGLGAVVIGTTAAMLALGVTVGASYGLTTSDLGVLPAIVGSAAAKLPAVWVIAGVTVALFGFFPRIAVAGSWAVLALVLMLELGWELGAVDSALFSISPFAWVYPLAGQARVQPLVVLTLIAVAFAGVGAAALRRRDIG